MALEPSFEEQFRNPPAAYRGAPFWAWNCRLDRDMVREMVEYFAEMGFGGFHIHSRTGMALPYMQPAYLELVRYAVEEARRQGLRAMLYDEDRWPSGAAGGLVTKTPRHRERRLVLTPVDRVDDRPLQQAVEEGAPYFVAAYRVTLTAAGTLEHYARVARDSAGDDVWYAFCLPGEESPWFNDQAYLDTLSPAAAAAFVETTHEGYRQAVGDYFGDTVPSIFTDEPRPAFRRRLARAHDRQPVETAWTPDLPETYEQVYDCSLLDTLPEIFWDLPDGRISPTRYRYHNHVTDRFAGAFIRTASRWCQQNGLQYTGHMLGEDSLFTQTSAVGDVMRCYPAFDLPGIDMLCDAMHLNTAKQTQSVCRQTGRREMMSELYGVTNWDFDFRGHKFQGDWQAALGVTLRVHHLAWTSMEGEAKRDYPASIGYQSPWYREYRFMEDHYARLNTALTRGEPVVSVAVLHPIESYWCRFGPEDTAFEALQEKENRFHDLTGWLLRDRVDFDFLCEATLPTMASVEGAVLRVGAMTYDTVIVPGCETLRGTTLALLQAFHRQGGRLVFLGDPPAYIDAQPSVEGARLYEQAQRLPFSRLAVQKALADKPYCTIQEANGAPCTAYIGQVRQDGADRWIFLAPCDRLACPDVAPAKKRTLTLEGCWQVTLYDTLTGERRPLPAASSDGATRLELTVYPQDSLLLHLQPAAAAENVPLPAPAPAVTETVTFETVPFTREEPNVLLLDRADGYLDGEPVAVGEEILRLDNQIRQRLGYPLRTNKFAQPWTVPQTPPEHTVTLHYTVHSAAALEGLALALERVEDCTICWNGQPVPAAVSGRYVDRAICTVALPPAVAGENRLVLQYRYGRRIGLEPVYILGDFDVALAGARAELCPPRRRLGFSSVTGQGMPFYGGNLQYELSVTVSQDNARLTVRIPRYRGALVGVALDGHPVGRIVTAPYTCTVEGVAAGEHRLTLTLYGNRFNTFGALHNCDTTDGWYGFMYWRSEGDAWVYEYLPRETGILASPQVTLAWPVCTQTQTNSGEPAVKEV